MGFSGPQLEDSAGVEVGEEGRSVEEYLYLQGRCRHYKMVGETHGSAWKNHPVAEVTYMYIAWQPGCQALLVIL